MSAMEFLKDDYLTEDEVLSILKIKSSTLNGRRSNGTEHPPYVEIGRARLYPKAMFKDWIAKRKVMWAVRGG